MSDSNPRDLIRQDIDDSRRDGLSLDTALVIRAENSWIGVGMEYDYVIARHGRMHEGWTLESQRLLHRDENGRSYDQLNIVLSDGRELSYFFDITDFYGREVLMSDEIRAMLDEDDAESGSRSRGDEGVMMDLDPSDMSAPANADGRDEEACFETAVIIQAETIWSSLCEEYEYLSRLHPLKHLQQWKDWTVRIDACLFRNGRYYDRIEVVSASGESQTYCFDVTNGYEDGLHTVSVKQGLMETIRNPSSYFQVKLGMAATARLMRYPEAEVMWAEVVALAHQYFEHHKARAVLAEALMRERAFLREWNDSD
jgi:hypothetical protein